MLLYEKCEDSFLCVWLCFVDIVTLRTFCKTHTYRIKHFSKQLPLPLSTKPLLLSCWCFFRCCASWTCETLKNDNCLWLLNKQKKTQMFLEARKDVSQHFGRLLKSLLCCVEGSGGKVKMHFLTGNKPRAFFGVVFLFLSNFSLTVHICTHTGPRSTFECFHWKIALLLLRCWKFFKRCKFSSSWSTMMSCANWSTSWTI